MCYKGVYSDVHGKGRFMPDETDESMLKIGTAVVEAMADAADDLGGEYKLALKCRLGLLRWIEALLKADTLDENGIAKLATAYSDLKVGLGGSA